MIKRYSGELVWLGIIAVVLIRVAMNWMAP